MSRTCICDHPGCDGVNHPPFDMAEHERRWQRLKEAALGGVTRHWSILDDREQHPIVWPVGMIPIKGGSSDD